MSMIFYNYHIPGSCPLASMGVWNAFIVYNPIDGETAFFSIMDRACVPFNDVQMCYVNQRFNEYCKERGVSSAEGPGEAGFDFEAHKDFMRGL